MQKENNQVQQALQDIAEINPIELKDSAFNSVIALIELNEEDKKSEFYNAVWQHTLVYRLGCEIEKTKNDGIS